MMWKLLLCGTALLAFGCTDEHESAMTLPPTTEPTAIPMQWSVLPVTGMNDTRVLINDNATLQNVCAKGKGEGIGIWGDYELTSNKGTETIVGFLQNVKIVYYGTAEDDSPSDWDYEKESDAKYWQMGGKYIFRAYYPQTAVKEHLISSSNARTFVINYNTTQLQEDLLVAYQPINTMKWNLSQPVPLKMRHALAGLKFQFELEEGLNETDYLTSCWLQNTAKRDFTSVALLAYGTEDEETGEYNPNWLDWRESYNSPATEQMYLWESKGLEFSRSTTTHKIATAYTDATQTTSGKSFINNDGYLLIIPQKSDGTVELCFTTREGGNTVYRVPIPSETRTSLARQRANNTYDENGALILGDAKDPDPIDEFGYGTDFVPGYLYNYTVTITKTNLDVTLSIKPWNELKSSFDIAF